MLKKIIYILERLEKQSNLENLYCKKGIPMKLTLINTTKLFFLYFLLFSFCSETICMRKALQACSKPNTAAPLLLRQYHTTRTPQVAQQPSEALGASPKLQQSRLLEIDQEIAHLNKTKAKHLLISGAIITTANVIGIPVAMTIGYLAGGLTEDFIIKVWGNWVLNLDLNPKNSEILAHAGKQIAGGLTGLGVTGYGLRATTKDFIARKKILALLKEEKENLIKKQ